MADEPETTPDPTPRRSFASTLKRGLLITVAALLVLYFGYRWLGTSEVRATIQRVYEDQGEFRVELVKADGQVLVAANRDMYFPHFKLDSADQQAKLHNLAVSQDTARVTVWGFRLSWFSVFPNVVDVEMVQTNVERRRALATKVAAAVLEDLRKKGVVQGGANLQDDTTKVIEEVLTAEERHPGAPPPR